MLGRGRRERSHDSLPESVDLPRAGIGNKTGFPRLAGFETHGGPRRDVEPVAEGELPIEGEGRVALRKMIVTSNLNWSIARIGH